MNDSKKATSVDVAAVGAELLRSAHAQHRGFVAFPVVEQPHQRVLLLALPAGGGLPEHDAPTAATLHCVSGSVTLVQGQDRWELGAGELIAIPQARHHVEAQAESLCLLTICTS